MIILDTNVVSELMRARPDPTVVAWADRQAEATLYLSTVTLAEIRFGIAAVPSGRRRTALDAVFETGIRPRFGNRVLDFDEPATREYAEIRADARARGHAIANADAMIAAIGRVYRYAIATRDVAPFETAGVGVINPFE